MVLNMMLHIGAVTTALMILGVAKTVTAVVLPEKEETCNDRVTGIHPIRDTFKYMVCKNGTGWVESCAENQIYDPDKRGCALQDNSTLETFCRARPNGDWLCPWDCHKFITCNYGWTDLGECNNNLAYDARLDACLDESSVPSCTLTSNKENNTTLDQSESDLINPEQLKKKLQLGDVRLIDVRMPWELRLEGRIAQSINIPVLQIEEAFKLSDEEFQSKYKMEKPSKYDCNLVFHCKSGIRGQIALNTAKSLGYKCAKTLKGGFDAWKLFLL